MNSIEVWNEQRDSRTCLSQHAFHNNSIEQIVWNLKCGCTTKFALFIYGKRNFKFLKKKEKRKKKKKRKKKVSCNMSNSVKGVRKLILFSLVPHQKKIWPFLFILTLLLLLLLLLLFYLQAFLLVDEVISRKRFLFFYFLFSSFKKNYRIFFFLREENRIFFYSSYILATS